ncbi:unnamed protein product [Kuraishia capsulata CBS 1993]|uniref:DH domain-containing protein n=1 Tax=Kuraishia capsulata CBS 1993 TaxID=1382522 RepID=W6MM61_9ASCO|nr:uncharacterized protein KUCA_T00003613001 [Kuraishia capsulata CBS 1993]CDK27634.1 unnamed protein product [Kuraishia capsulata CBS 1993]
MSLRLLSQRQASARITSSNYGDRSQSFGSLNLSLSAEDEPVPDWASIVKDAVYFYGFEEIFGHLVAVIFDDPKLNSGPSCVIVSAKYGEFLFRSMTITSKSRFYPAVENLPSHMQSSNVRRALAIALLRLGAECDLDWDETDSGELAGRFVLVDKQTPSDSGDQIFKLGYFQSKLVNSLLVDVVYDNASGDDTLTDKNNKLAFLLGEQLDNLFDPLTEYSPEPTERVYVPPSVIAVDDDVLVKSICQELIRVQTNSTVSLVSFLQKFIIPLRIKVLEGKMPDWTTSKLNQIFPPTIDEVTRINCIFLDALKLTQGESFEVMKACAMTLPYFYKAYMRHEAATKNFHRSLESFFAEAPEEIVANRTYDRHMIESVVHSSLSLAKIKIILGRLVDTKVWKQAQLEEVHSYYDNVCNIIDSFGTDKLKPYNNRVFTPTGKLLTELASGWPSELHYGWLNRRVVAVFDVEYLMEPSMYNSGLVILFSDHMVFLQIVDDEYYYIEHSGSDALLYKPSIADMMMHSLINEVPLSSDIPKLKVSYWTDVSNVFASSYDEGESVCLKIEDEVKLLRIKNTRLRSGEYVVDLINKAKVLNKTQLFHLFKSEYEPECVIYYTAQELMAYREEKSRSPLTIFLNMNVNSALLDEHGLDRAVVLTLLDSEDVEINLVSRDESEMTKVMTAEFASVLSQIVRERLANTVYTLNTAQESKVMDALISFFKEDRYLEERSLALRMANRETVHSQVHSKSHSKSISGLTITPNSKTRVSSSGTVRKQVRDGEKKKWFKVLKTKVSRVFNRRDPDMIQIQSDAQSTTNMTTASSSLFVNSRFEFPLKELPAVTLPKMDRLTSPVIPRDEPGEFETQASHSTPVPSPVRKVGMPLAQSSPEVKPAVKSTLSPIVTPTWKPTRKPPMDETVKPTRIDASSTQQPITEPVLEHLKQTENQSPIKTQVAKDTPVWKSPEVTKRLALMLRELGNESSDEHNWSLLDAESNTSFHDALMDNSRFAKLLKPDQQADVSRDISREEPFSLAKLLKSENPNRKSTVEYEGFPELLRAPKPFGQILQQNRVFSDKTDDDDERFYTPKEHPSEIFENGAADDTDDDSYSNNSSTLSASLIDPSLLLPRERLLEMPTNSDDTMLSGDSYGYLGELLTGSMNFKREESKPDVAYDKNLDIAFASRLRESSVKYLADFIHSGYTQADIHGLLNEEKA